MPPTARWFLKTALVYLVVSLLLGIALASAHPPWLGALAPVYFHLFMVGWVSQTIFGVAYWMFPRLSADAPRGSEGLAVVTYVTLNAGLVARTVAEPMVALGGPWPAILTLSAAMQWVAALAFAVNTWPRVKAR